MRYLEHHIVDHCNLKCRGCSHFSPLAPEWFESVEDFKKDFTQLASIMQVETIRLMGGEPLLHPKVKEFLIITRNLFPQSEIQLVTNGILLQQNQELINTINQSRIKVCVSDYKIFNNFKEQVKGINLLRVDNKTDMYNISLSLKGDKDINEAFKNCDLRFKYGCNFFQNGKFYHCSIGACINFFNDYFHQSLPKPEGISIYGHTEAEILDYLNKPIQLCTYCDTIVREHTYKKFSQSKKEITEWICH